MAEARNLFITAAPARLAYSMISLGIYFKIYREGHSISIASLGVGLNGMAGAITAGIRASVIDRIGMIVPLRILAPSYAAMILVFNTLHGAHLLVLIAFILGFVAPPINLSIRPLWKSTVGPELLRSAYAVDSAMMGVTVVVGPVVATALSLSSHPASALILCSGCMAISGVALSCLSSARKWQRAEGTSTPFLIFRVPGIRLLAIEGIFIGLGMGAFETTIPATTTLHHVVHRTGSIFAVMAIAQIFGSLLAGVVAKRLTPLAAFKKNYLLWSLFALPLFLTTPNWSLYLVASLIGMVGGAQQVFYMEILEAIRPAGTAASALGWLWTFEGTAEALGNTIGGWLSDRIAPSFAFGFTSLTIVAGMMVVRWGSRFLAKADRPTTDALLTSTLEDLDGKELN